MNDIYKEIKTYIVYKKSCFANFFFVVRNTVYRTIVCFEVEKLMTKIDAK